MKDKNEDIQNFHDELINNLQIEVEAGLASPFTEVTFFDHVTDMLCEAERYDNFEHKSYRNSRRGFKIDGYNWNPTEKILSAVIIKFNGIFETISQTGIEKLGKQASKFISNITNEVFIESMAYSDPGRELAETMLNFYDQAIKYRVLIITDSLMSDRVKLNKLKVDSINNKETFFEICDLNEIFKLSNSYSSKEPFTVDFSDYGGIQTLPANFEERKGIKSYVCLMPGDVLRDLFDKHGQRLLESNVRTFLQFRGKVNKGMKETLVKNPENFFAYNNGLTVTASGIGIDDSEGFKIMSLDNMQIVNGGQTTQAIYFTPHEKSTQKGIDYKSINLKKVFVQMKLTVIEDEEIADEIKVNVAQYANTQNKVQDSDLVSNHPLHIEIEKHSRGHYVPAGENSISTKWFYERARGQYDTRLRVLKSETLKKKFQTEYPKKQKFTKTDMAKFENTWRMRPWEVKKGAQGNLILMGPYLVNLWKDSQDNFGIGFYQDLIAKAILFKSTDHGIQYKSDWYKNEPGLKAETVTFTIALLRHILKKDNKDINLKRIYDNQKISDSLESNLLTLGKIVRDNIEDKDFRDGASNPSEFCKTEKGWKKIKTINFNLSLDRSDWLNLDEIQDAGEGSDLINKVGSEKDKIEFAMSISPKKWKQIYEYLITNKLFKKDHIDMLCLNKFTVIDKNPSLKGIRYPQDFFKVLELRELAIDDGFIDL